ncbi:MAG: hypothetical protein JXB10_20685 [Pirellulales bacterium]|nr:hypothetical protein [Pirellulales bacterium]
MTTPFKELAGSPRESFGPDGMEAERRLICAWDDRRALVEEILGDGYEFGGQNPVAYPGVSSVVAVRVRVEPLTDDLVKQDLAELTDGPNAYQGFARLTVNYELLTAADRADLPEIEPQTFLTYRMDRGTETVTFGGDALYWPGNPEATFPSAAEGRLLLPVTIHRLTWHRAVNPPWSAIRVSSGTFNDAPFLGAAEGTLLFDGAAAERVFLRISDLDTPEFSWRIEYFFREKPLTTQATQPLFATSDFSKLLKFES